MRINRIGRPLLAGTALALLAAGPAAAQDCAQKADEVAQKVQQADLPSQEQEYAQSAIESARALADQGLEESCMQTLAEIGDRTGVEVAIGEMSGAEETAATTTQQGQQQTQSGQQQAQATGQVGRGTLDEPEWQAYSGMETKYGPLAWLTFDEVVGADVTAEDGAAIGEILELVKAEDEDMIYAVVDASAADKLVAVPVNELEVQGDDKQIVLTGASLEDMPAYERSQ